MLNGNERLIIVLGMAHSGTTILTYILQKHPDVVCCTNGSEAWILENTWLPSEQADPIQQLLDKFPTKRVMLKRPWNEVWHGEWMKREMPNAKFIYCYRNFADISASWCKSNSMIDDSLRNGGVDHQKQFYEMCWQRGSEFGSTVSNFWQHYHQHFVENPKKVIAETAAWLGLSPYRFDVSLVSKHLNIKDVLCRA
jgi:hypothetical protein